MTRKRVTDEQYGQLTRRVQEVTRRVDEGTVPFEVTMTGLQGLIEGNTDDKPIPRTSDDRVWTTEVDYTVPIRTLIKGITDHWRVEAVSPYFNSTDIPCQQGVVTATLDLEFVVFKKPVTILDAPLRLEKYGFRGLTAHELVAFSRKYDRLCYQIPIPALQTKLRHPSGGHYHPYVDRTGDNWIFGIMPAGNALALATYLAVRESKS